MSLRIEITVPADEDQDDCLSASAAVFIAEHPSLAGWDLSPRWTDDNVRTTVTLTVPAWAVDLPADRHALAELLERALPGATVVPRVNLYLGVRSQALDASDPDVRVTTEAGELSLWWDESGDTPGWIAKGAGVDNEPVGTFAHVLELLP